MPAMVRFIHSCILLCNVISEQLEACFDLEVYQVNYCTLGRADLKPTHIWTNVKGQALSGNRYLCRCGAKGVHKDVRGENCVEAAIVPQELAVLVATKVKAQLESDNIGDTNLNVIKKE